MGSGTAGTAAVAEEHVKIIGAEDHGRIRGQRRKPRERDANGLPRYAAGSETIVLRLWAELVIVKFDMSLPLS